MRTTPPGNKQRGFTLIEVLIYMAIFSIFIGAFAATVNLIQNTQLRSRAALEVDSQGAHLMRVVTTIARNAGSITAPSAGSTTASLHLMTDEAIPQAVAITLSDGQLYISENNSVPIALSNDRVVITSFLVTNYSRAGTPGALSLQLKLQNASSTPGQGNYEKIIYGTVALR